MNDCHELDEDTGLLKKGAHWAKPELVVKIGFTEWTRDGKLRHPSYIGLRDVTNAQEGVREDPRAA